jgi:hypothetical protein
MSPASKPAHRPAISRRGRQLPDKSEYYMASATLPVRAEEYGAKIVLVGLLDHKQLQALFGKAKETIINWKRNYGLPHITIPGDAHSAVRFVLAEVVAWAIQNRKRYNLANLGLTDEELNLLLGPRVHHDTKAPYRPIDGVDLPVKS